MVRLRQLAWSALAGGVTAGVLLFGLQSAWITPLIREAERAEPSLHGVPETRAPDIHSPAPAEKRGESATPPPVAPPAEPTGNSILITTLLADLAVGLGYALLLCAGILLAGRKVNALRGLAWGACGYAALVLAPSLGLPPEAPG
ncbi:MAG: CbtA family protein, partial [bacterium]